MKKTTILTCFLALSLLLGACGRTTRPSDLAAQATSVAAGGPAPVAGTPVILPLVVRDAPGVSAPTQPVEPVAAAPATETVPPTAVPEPTQAQQVRFAVIGDYGAGGNEAADVAYLVAGWQPEFIITVGDNNYPDGAQGTIDANIGQFYHTYISPYAGSYGQGAGQNRFFPALGNHDYGTGSAQPYLDYFTLPGNERYYDFTWGPVHFFALNSDPNEPDGVGSSSPQAAWLQGQMAGSTSAWQIVYFHAAPYSSGYHHSTDWMRWPFQEWGADAVLAGHDHDYERLLINGLSYFVNGLGGGAIYSFGDKLEGSQVRYNDNYGAMLVDASVSTMTFQFITRQGQVIDSYTIER